MEVFLQQQTCSSCWRQNLLRLGALVVQEVPLVSLAGGGVDGDDRIADLIGPRVHHFGNIDDTTVLIHCLQPWQQGQLPSQHMNTIL